MHKQCLATDKFRDYYLFFAKAVKWSFANYFWNIEEWTGCLDDIFRLHCAMKRVELFLDGVHMMRRVEKTIVLMNRIAMIENCIHNIDIGIRALQAIHVFCPVVSAYWVQHSLGNSISSSSIRINIKTKNIIYAHRS